MKTLTVKACLIIYCLLWMSSCRSSIPFISSPHHRPQGIYHTVKSKETLWRICQTYKVKMQEIAEINNISRTSQIKIGDKIFIPGAKKQYRVILPKAKQPLHRKTTPKIIKSSTVFAWPVKGKVLRRFGMQNGQKHDGINIKASKGKTIKASRAGKVIFSAPLDGYGKTVIIQHTDNYATVYARTSVNYVTAGVWVKQGQHIAGIGNADSAQAEYYLHFQIRRWNKPRNPLFYLQDP